MTISNSKTLSTYAQQDTVTLSSIEDLEKFNQKLLWMPVQKITAVVKRIWWHTKGYGVILGIMLLTLVSIIFLIIHWFQRNFLPILKHQFFSGT